MTLEQGQVLFSIVKTWDNCFSLETIIEALTRKLQMQNNETIWGCLSVRSYLRRTNNTDRCIFEVMPNERKIFGFT